MADCSAGTITVELAYARPDRQFLLALELSAGTTAWAALVASGLLEHCPELQSGEPVLGVWSRRVPADRVLISGDRLEIYRPLQADPKQARRRRAARQGGGRRARPASPSDPSGSTA